MKTLEVRQLKPKAISKSTVRCSERWSRDCWNAIEYRTLVFKGSIPVPIPIEDIVLCFHGISSFVWLWL